MILDYVKVLEDDATLQLLLNGNAGNKKLYPLRAPDGETSPWIIYLCSSYGSSDDVLDEATITLINYSETYSLALQVSNRVIELLDIFEGAKKISSSGYQFLCSRLITGGSEGQEEDTRLFYIARTFHVKFKRRTGG